MSGLGNTTENVSRHNDIFVEKNGEPTRFRLEPACPRRSP